MFLRSLALLVLTASPALAEVYEVKMLNRNDTGPMVYEPDYLAVKPGDTIRFLSTQPGHNAASIEGMLPEGAEAYKSGLGKDFDLTVTVPGLYGVKCSPHYAMGMVMLIQVGDEVATPDIPAAVPARAKKRFEDILARQAQ